MALQSQTLEDLQEILERIKKEHGNGADSESAEPVTETVALDYEEEEVSGAISVTDADLFLDSTESGGEPHTAGKRFAHRGKDWNPLTTRSGTDKFSFSIPKGYKFDHYEIKPVETSFPYELNASSSPRKGATGSGVISVKWKLWGLGVVSYRVIAVCVSGKAPAVRIEVGSNRWFERALHLADQRQPFKLVLSGPDASNLWKALKPHVRDTDTELAVEITIAICATVIALAGFTTIALVLTRVIERGCNATVDFTAPSLNGGSAPSIAFDVGCRA